MDRYWSIRLAAWLMLTLVCFASPVTAMTRVSASVNIFGDIGPPDGFPELQGNDSETNTSANFLPLADPLADAAASDTDSGYSAEGRAESDLHAGELRAFATASGAPGTGLFGEDFGEGFGAIVDASASLKEFITFIGTPGTLFTITYTMDFDDLNDTIFELDGDGSFDGFLLANKTFGDFGNSTSLASDFFSFDVDADIADRSKTSDPVQLDSNGEYRTVLSAAITASVWQLGGESEVTVDFGATAALGITTSDPGVTFNSDSGQFLNPIPVPTAVWLFGSGLIGLIGIAKRTRE